MAIQGALEMYSWILMIFVLLTDFSTPVYGYDKCYNQAENASIPAAHLCFSNEAYGNRVVIDAFRAKESTTVNCQCTITSATATHLNFSSYDNIQPGTGLGCGSAVVFQVNGQIIPQNCFVESKQLPFSSSATVNLENLQSSTSTEYCILVKSDAALNISCIGDPLPPRTTTTTTLASETTTFSLKTSEQTTETTTNQPLTTSTAKQDTTLYTTTTTMTQSSESLETTSVATTVETSVGSETTTVNNTTVVLPITTQHTTSNGLSTDTSQTTTTTVAMTSTDRQTVNDTATITNVQTTEGMTTTASSESVSSETTERETTENNVASTTAKIQTTSQTLTSSDSPNSTTTTTTSGEQTTTSTSPPTATIDTTRVSLGSSTVSGGQSTTSPPTTGDNTTSTSPMQATRKTTTVPPVLTTSRQQLDRGTPWSGIIPAILIGVIIFCALIYAFVKRQRSREIKYPDNGTLSDSRNSMEKDPGMGEINFGYDAYDEGPKLVTEFSKSPETIEMDFSQGELDPKNLTTGTFIRYSVKDYSVSNGNASHGSVEPKQNDMDVYF